MAIVVATFGTPEDVTTPGFDGKSVRFPVALIDAQYLGTPRQTSETKSGRITVEITRSLLAVWALSSADLVKVLFQLAKEHLEKLIKNSEQIGPDVKVEVNSYTHKGPCPFDPQFIEEPRGVTVQLEISRPIGFVWNA